MNSPSVIVPINENVKIESYLDNEGSIYVRVKGIQDNNESGTRLCKAIPYLGNYCKRCAHPLIPNATCTAHEPSWEYLDKTLAVGLYLTEDVIIELASRGFKVPNILTDKIRALKSSMNVALELGASMALIVKEKLFNIGICDIDYITYVPKLESELKVDIDTNHKYNQAKILAEVISKVLNIDLIDAVIKTRPFSLLGRNINERRERTFSYYRVNQKIAREISRARILLVDDVRTSGATGNAIAKELKEAGARKVYLLVAGRATFKTQFLEFIDYLTSSNYK